MRNILKELRTKQGLTHRELAKKTGINHTSIFYYETGTRNPTLKMACRLASFFGVPVETLFPQFDPNNQNNHTSSQAV
ncbi:MAG: helix-turn-helix transcriptional regulator [Bacilli bacterium]|jgi:DNA-binding XRE family transcriptional regulator